MKERFVRWLVWHLPKDVIYWAVIRATAFATSERFPQVEVPAVAAMDVACAWRELA
jgi:hypothetical protein